MVDLIREWSEWEGGGKVGEGEEGGRERWQHCPMLVTMYMCIYVVYMHHHF